MKKGQQGRARDRVQSVRPGATARRSISVISMTGFGRAMVTREGTRITVEARSVNNRFTDIILRLPREYATWEAEVRAVVEDSVERGRVELSVVRSSVGVPASRVIWNEDLLRQIFTRARRAARELNIAIEADQLFSALVARRELFEVVPDADVPAGERELLFEVIAKALRFLHDQRIREGANLGRDLVSRVHALESLLLQARRRAPAALEEIRRRLGARLKKLCDDRDIDPARLATEVVMIAERSDIEEELVRIESHLRGMSDTLQVSPNGRKLEFYLQELGREFNTIGSKAQDAAVQGIVVEAKTELERMREQLQNIE